MNEQAFIFGIVGYIGAGKDEFGRAVVAANNGVGLAMGLGDLVRNLAEMLNPILEVGKGGSASLQSILITYDGWDRAKRELPSVRAYLQLLGESAKRVLGTEVWTNAIQEKIGHAVFYREPFVQTSVRFEHEVDQIRGEGGIVGLIVRPGVDRTSDHRSEDLAEDWMGRPSLADFVVYNDGSIEDLHAKVKSFVPSITS